MTNLGRQYGIILLLGGMFGLSTSMSVADEVVSFHDAASIGDLSRVTELLAAGSAIDEPDSLGRTPLMLAALAGHDSVSSMLLGNGASATAKTEDKTTVLMIAAGSGMADLAQSLIAKGADVHAKNKRGLRPLMLAAESGDTATINVLLAHGAEPTKNWGSWTPLMFAERNGHLDACRLLVEQGVEVNKGSSVLYEALFDGYEDVALYLIEQGAKPNSKANDQGWRPLMIAAERGLVSATRSLVDHGAKVNVATKDGWTPLMFAARQGSYVITRLLVEHGADIKARTKEDKLTSLMLAANGGYAEIADLLIEHGADVKRKTKNRKTVLQYAASGGNLALVEKCLDMGLKPNDGTRRPIHYAFGNDHDDVGRLLLERGAEMKTLRHHEFDCYATGRCFWVIAGDCLKAGDTATAVEHLGVAVDFFGRAEKKYRKSADKAEKGGSSLFYSFLRLAAASVDLHQGTKKNRITNYSSLFPEIKAAAPDQSRAFRIRESADKCKGLCDDSRKILVDLGHPLPPEPSD